jgi:hypothetical protein
MFVFNGYRWTTVDLLLALAIAFGDIYFAMQTITNAGVSLASIAGSVWGYGTLMFIVIYQFPILGQSVEAERLKNKKELTRDEVRILFQRRDNSPMNENTIKYFFLFFFLSGGLALAGLFTNT